MTITLIAAAVLGIAIGVLSGLLGVGGGTVMIPMFRLAFGLSALESTATSLFTIIPTSISGLITHIRRKTCIPKLGVVLGLGGACLSPVGVWLASLSPSWLVMVAAAIAIAYSGYSMVKKVRSMPKGEDAGKASVATAASTPPPQPTLTGKQLLAGVAIGAIAGLASGYIGLGGGFLMIPLMLALLDLPMKLASGTSLIAVMLIAIPGTITQGVLGNIDYAVGIATAVGTIPGAFFGAGLVSRVPERTLRIVFSVFLFAGAVLLVAKELSLFV